MSNRSTRLEIGSSKVPASNDVRRRRSFLAAVAIVLGLGSLVGSISSAGARGSAAQDEQTLDLPGLHQATGHRSNIRFLGFRYPDLGADPFHTDLFFARVSGETGPAKFEIRPGTVLSLYGNRMVAVKTTAVELGMEYESMATVQVELCHLGMEPWQRVMHEVDGGLGKRSERLEEICSLEGFGEKSLDVRQAMVWMAVAFEEGQLTPGASALFDEYRRSMQESMRLNEYQPFKIDAGDWAEAYSFARKALPEAEMVVDADADGRKRVGATEARDRDTAEKAPASEPAIADHGTTLGLEAMALSEAQKARTIAFEARFSDLESTPYAVGWTAKRVKRAKAGMRFESPAGSIFDSYGESFVCLDPIAFELGADVGATSSGVARVYARLLPRHGLSTAHKLVPVTNSSDYLLYLASLPEMQKASDSVRQAAMFRVGGSSANFASYELFYDTEFTSPTGDVVTRPDPYAISRQEWSKAERLVEIVTPARQRALDASAMERKAIADEKARVKSEEEARIAAAKHAEEARLADRQARTVALNLQAAVRQRLITASLNELRLGPERVALRLVPTERLGDKIIDLRILAGTRVREVGGQRTAYLEGGAAVVEGSEPVEVSLGCLLHDLGDVGPGGFEVGEVDALAATILGSKLNRRFGIAFAGVISRSRGSLPLAQLMMLIHESPERTVAEWQAVFRAAGREDGYLSATSELGDSEFARDAAKVHAAAELLLVLVEREARDVGKPDGLAYTEADLLGTWRPMAKSKVIGPLAELAGRKAEEQEFLRPKEELPDLDSGRARMEAAYNDAERETKKLWAKFLRSKDPKEKAATTQQDYTFEITFYADHTFKADFQYWRLGRLRRVSDKGDWSWDGTLLTIAEGVTRFRNIRPFFTMHRGSLIVRRDGLASPTAKPTHFALVLEKR